MSRSLHAEPRRVYGILVKIGFALSIGARHVTSVAVPLCVVDKTKPCFAYVDVRNWGVPTNQAVSYSSE